MPVSVRSPRNTTVKLIASPNLCSLTRLWLTIPGALPVDQFVGRSLEMEALDQATDNATKPVVVAGMGGVGKSELMVQYGR